MSHDETYELVHISLICTFYSFFFVLMLIFQIKEYIKDELILKKLKFNMIFCSILVTLPVLIILYMMVKI